MTLFRPMIDNLTLEIDQDVSNADVTVSYLVRWDETDQLMNLAYTESWKLVGVDPGGDTTIYAAPVFVGGLRPNGKTTTQRTHEVTIPFSDLDEDPNGPDEIAAVVTLTPQLPSTATGRSAEVTP